jgi:hypothetical protein
VRQVGHLLKGIVVPFNLVCPDEFKNPESLADTAVG